VTFVFLGFLRLVVIKWIQEKLVDKICPHARKRHIIQGSEMGRAIRVCICGGRGTGCRRVSSLLLTSLTGNTITQVQLLDLSEWTSP
jgi:hypothetical protein